jgi:formamidopyrimidine-DNA glycosylase
MPELPEVESIRLGLESDLAGRRIQSVVVSHPRMLRRQHRPDDFAERLAGRRVVSLGRRGKFLEFPLSGDMIWVTHLGMSGRIRTAGPDEEMEPHTHVVVGLDSRRQVRFVDPRTFGFMAVFTPEEHAESTLAALGPDALTGLPSSASLAAALARRSAPIKALLLDQRLVAGVGNIYADEALHRAGISPLRPGGSLDRGEVQALRRGIRDAIAAGLRWGGTSLGDLAYLLPDGRAGENLQRLRAYGREGERCRRCGGTIERTVVRARSTFWCGGCQR